MADTNERNADLKALIRTIPDFPKPGIQFRDITTLLLDPQGWATAIERMVAAVSGPVDLVAGIEARGFLFAAALAAPLKAGVLLIRKDGKLPGATIAEDYALAYGTRAAVRLLHQAGAVVSQAQFLVDLPDLGGADALRADDIDATALIHFPGH
jgi:adenine phosphoribosyltransferase